MLFNSFDYAIFLPITFLLYWFIFNKKLKTQNLFLVVASYVFYGWWDCRFLILIIISTSVDYFIGINISRQESKTAKKLLLYLSVFVNLGILGFFKYYNFFLDSFVSTFSIFGFGLSAQSLNIILPVGISFYTFQTLSYSIDVYRNKIKPTSDFIAFAAFVSFFPQLVAGPIERASNLLPQFKKHREFDLNKAVDGLRQILWGLFKKIVIADNCASVANDIFNNYPDHSGSTLLVGAILFSFQIYGDFSGYSDIAIGTARLFGFNLMQNFAFPYFSRDIAEFWRRWHISLSSWFRDFVYIPLGGSKKNHWITTRNIFIIFLVSGFWHGANLTFLAWGFVNAILLLPLVILKKNRNNINIVAEGKNFPNIKELLQMLGTFIITSLAWVFFRSKSIYDSIQYLSEIFSNSIFSKPQIIPIGLMSLIVLFMAVEWIQRSCQHALQFENTNIPRSGRWIIYLSIIMMIFILGGNKQDFIYFKF